MATKVSKEVRSLITDIKLWKKPKDWEPKVATGFIVIGGCIQVDIALVSYQGGYFIGWPKRKSKNKETGEDVWYDQVKPIDSDGKIDKELGAQISQLVVEAYEALPDNDDDPF